MSSAGPSLTKTKEAEEAPAGQTAEVSAEGNSNCCPEPLPPPSSPDEKLGMGLCGRCQEGWLLSPLDDVRYLISCTNWY